MKKKHILFALYLLAFSSFSCSTDSVLSEPDQIGSQVFEILKELNVKPKAEYLQNFMSIEEIREMGKNMELPLETDLRNELTSATKEEYEDNIAKYYNELKEDAAIEGIVWSEIEYLDYVYEVETEQGMEATAGKLYIKSGNDTYKVGSAAIFNGAEYKLILIKNINKQ